MKHRVGFFLLSAILLLLVVKYAEAEPGKCVIKDCHPNMQTCLPEKHMAVKGENNISACRQCHTPASETLKDTFSAKIHKKHFAEKKLQCAHCHCIENGVSFALPSINSSGAPDKETLDALTDITAEWANSPYLSAIHAAKDITCAACHGNALPLLDDKPTKETCLVCHKSYAELAEKTPGQDHPSRNPHNSHLGPINCTVCHKAHEYSANYCMNCHKFPMRPIPGGKVLRPPKK